MSRSLRHGRNMGHPRRTRPRNVPMAVMAEEMVFQYDYVVHYVTRTLGMSLVGCAPYTYEHFEVEQFDAKVDFPLYSVLSRSGQILFSCTNEFTAKGAVDHLNFEAAKRIMSSA